MLLSASAFVFHLGLAYVINIHGAGAVVQEVAQWLEE